MTKTSPELLAYLRERSKRPDVTEKRRLYRERTKEHRYAVNREYMAAYNKTPEQRERARKNALRYCKDPKNKAKILSYNRRDYVRAKKKSADKAYYELNKAALIERSRKRRGIFLSAPGDFTDQQWMHRIEYYGWRCLYCYCKLTPKTLTMEHMIPLSRGGSNWPSNLAPSCKHCNTSKGKRTIKEYSTFYRGY